MTRYISFVAQVTRVEYRALADVRYRIRCFLNFSEACAREVGLEPQQHQLLLAVHGLPEDTAPTIGRVAERLQIQHHSAVELVDRLATKGLITRTRSSEDRREVFVKLTPRGEHILAELTMHTSAELRSAAPALVASLRKLASRQRNSRPRRAKSAVMAEA